MNDITARLMQLFVEEMDERATSFENDLLALGHQAAGPERTETIASMLRTAHSLKGASASVGSEPVEAVAHALEELLIAARDEKVALGPGQLALLFRVADAFRETARRLRDEDGYPEDLPALSSALGRVAAGEAPDAPETGVTAAAEATQSPSDSAVRVTAEKLDTLLQESGELLVASYFARNRVSEFAVLREGVRRLRNGHSATSVRELERSIERLSELVEHDHRAVEQAARRVDAQIRHIRMMPFASVSAGIERVVHDAAQTAGKEVQLRVTGGDIELDRSILRGLRDPLRHLVRNAVDHGIESPERRRQSGKPRVGTISIAAALRGEGVEVTVGDDGGGIDVEALRKKAQERGLDVDDLDLTSTIFLPGFSTAERVTELSGRGVGLDSVRAAIYGMRGTITVLSTPGRETRFALMLPLTLTSVHAVLATLGDETFAIDSGIVVRVLRVRADAIVPVEGRPVVSIGDHLLPVVPLAAVLGWNAPRPGDDAFVIVVVVGLGDQQIALGVDGLTDEREIVLRSLGPRLSGLPAFSGATVLSDGSIALTLRSQFLLERAMELTRTMRHRVVEKTIEVRKRVLLVDDSVTTRAVERSILEAAGYDVVTAGDGREAWQALAAGEFDIIVSDVDMPNMDGFALVGAVRDSPRFRSLPVVLVTARESDDDKRRGMEVGADAYVLKSSFDQQRLLDTILELL